MKRREIRRRKQWPNNALNPAGVFCFGLWWGILVGMTLMGCLLQLGGK